MCLSEAKMRQKKSEADEYSPTLLILNGSNVSETAQKGGTEYVLTRNKPEINPKNVSKGRQRDAPQN